MDDPQLEFGGEEPEYEEAEIGFREKPDGATDPAGEAGWFLQREREKRGETLEYAGEATGIHPYHVEAIEFGDMTRMPTRMEALEMISAYAQYLGFDPEPLINHYIEFLPRPVIAPRPSHPANPAPLSSAKILTFGKMPKLMPLNFKISSVPGGAGGLIASLAGAIFLFAGASWMMIPSAEVVPQETGGMVADPMPTASTGPGCKSRLPKKPC
jgi:transcriptional regulator with XRE-family HTH domain